MFLYEIILIILALGGLYVANKIRLEKKRGHKLVCPLNGNCEQVLTSDFAKIAGIPLEMAGIPYYLLIIIANSVFIFIPSLKISLVGVILFGITLFGFLFSVYLVSVQAFILKNWCTWCLYSAMFSTLIFMASTAYFIIFLDQLIWVMFVNPWFFALVNIIGYGVGAAMALVIEIMTIKSLRDFKLNQQEKITLMYLWQILWSIIFLIIISTFAILVFKIKVLESLRLFEIKTAIFAVIILLSAITSFVLLPKLNKSKIGCSVMHVVSASFYRHIAIAASTAILISWLITIFISKIFSCPCLSQNWLIAYVAIVLVGIFLVLLIIRFFDKRLLEKIKKKSDNRIK